ncbi:hypothetical protein V9L05_01135 [Bernardetia sp. Wsw4-3y2]
MIYFFQYISVSDFIGITPLETFASYDVMKNPENENDFVHFVRHLE